MESVYVFFNDPATTEIYALSLHDALPIFDLSQYAGSEIVLRFAHVTDDASNRPGMVIDDLRIPEIQYSDNADNRSEEHTSELQSRQYLVCRLLLVKKKNCNNVTRSS